MHFLSSYRWTPVIGDSWSCRRLLVMSATSCHRCRGLLQVAFTCNGHRNVYAFGHEVRQLTLANLNSYGDLAHQPFCFSRFVVGAEEDLPSPCEQIMAPLQLQKETPIELPVLFMLESLHTRNNQGYVDGMAPFVRMTTSLVRRRLVARRTRHRVLRACCRWCFVVGGSRPPLGS